MRKIMNFLKAAAGTLLAGIIGAGMVVSVSADHVISAGGETFEVVDIDPSQDAGYLKYKHARLEEALDRRSPAGRIRSDYTQLCSFGSYLTHDTRFNGMDRDFCLDVSQWQGEIDWKEVKKSGISNVIIRLGVRGYGSAGTLMMDDKYYENIEGAKAAGFNVGVYFYTQAISTAEAKQEADFCAAALKGYDLELPVYFDIESVDWDEGRLDNSGLDKKGKTALCRAFCDQIETYGYQSGVYANKNWLENYIDGPALGNDYKTWIAAYMSSIDYAGIYDMWQYSSKAEIDGISGYVDISVMYDVDYTPPTVIEAEMEGSVMTWNAADYADGYTVYGNDGGDNYVVADCDGTSFDVAGQNASCYCVAAYNYFGGKRYYGSTCEPVNGFGGRVGQLYISRSGIDKITVSWDAVDEAAGYEIRTSRDGGDYGSAGRTEDTSFTVEGEELQNVTVKVRPYDESGVCGGYSDEIMLIGNAPSDTPVIFQTGARLVWNSIADADGYIVTYENAEGLTMEYTVSDAFMDIKEDIMGSYYVQAYTKLDGRWFRSETSNVIDFEGVSHPPRGEILLDSDDNGLVWNRLTDALGYVVYQADPDGGAKEIARVTECSYTADDLAGAVYFVKGYNTKGKKEYFTEASNSVTIDLNEVTEAKLESFADGAAFISWNSIEDCDEYMVYLDTGSGYELYTTVRGTMAVIGGLDDAAFASVRVKGYIGSEEYVRYSAFSNQLYIIGDDENRPQQEVFSFDDLMRN